MKRKVQNQISNVILSVLCVCLSSCYQRNAANENAEIIKNKKQFEDKLVYCVFFIASLIEFTAFDINSFIRKSYHLIHKTIISFSIMPWPEDQFMEEPLSN